MKKIDVSYLQIVVGLILKFGNIDVNDISVLMDMVDIDDLTEVIDKDIGKYICKNDNGRYEFDISVIRRYYEDIDDFYEVMRDYQGEYVGDILDGIDLFEFVLRKIKMKDNVLIDNYDKNFSGIERCIIKELKKRKYINDYWYDVSDDCLSTMVAMFGDLYLFKIDYVDEIDNFSKIVRDSGYNDKLLDAYFVTYRFDMGIEYVRNNIMNIDNFLDFCCLYGINPCMSVDAYNNVNCFFVNGFEFDNTRDIGRNINCGCKKKGYVKREI